MGVFSPVAETLEAAKFRFALDDETLNGTIAAVQNLECHLSRAYWGSKQVLADKLPEKPIAPVVSQQKSTQQEAAIAAAALKGATATSASNIVSTSTSFNFDGKDSPPKGRRVIS